MVGLLFNSDIYKMGGGDLNTKKSWHPNTMKNQERVWKAEQAAAEEKKRIMELQRERTQEHERAALNELAQRNFGQADNRLHWMYDKPDKPAQHEDYLLGKELGKNEPDHTQNAIPAVSRRVVGSSMNTTLDDTQVDLVRKMREDPLLLVKERERAARAALLNNPLQRKRLADLLRREKEQKESKQKESKAKKKLKKKDKDLDNMLAAKLNALGGEKGIDLSSLLNSNDSSSESSVDDAKQKKKKKMKEKIKKKSKKSKKKSSDSDAQSSDGEVDEHEKSTHNKYKMTSKGDQKNSKSSNHDYKYRPDKHDERKHKYSESDDLYKKKTEKSSDRHGKSNSQHYKDKSEPIKRRSDSYSESEGETKQKKSKLNYSEKNREERHKGDDSPVDNKERERRRNRHNSPDDRYRDEDRHKRRDSPHRERSHRFSSGINDDRTPADRGRSDKFAGKKEKRQGLSEAERAAKLAEMTAAGQEREAERSRRVANQRAQDADEDAKRGPRSANNEARALPDSLESRIRSNRHYIQRDKTHMNQNFARR